MVDRNPDLAKLKAGYLFPEITRRKNEYLKIHPEANIISLGVGNTTEPLTPHIVAAMAKRVAELGVRETYTGYGPEQGIVELRESIAKKWYANSIHANEIFISDGAKSDFGRLQALFGSSVSIAVQDPTYPVYVDGSVIVGLTGEINSKGQYKKVTYLPCTKEHGFFPNLADAPRTDLIYFCNPNNPTGIAVEHDKIEELVRFAQKNKSIIIYDAAYAGYINNNKVPKSIFEIPGAREVAIEINSFSKMIGFTGVRLGWCVVPDELCFSDATKVRTDWNRVVTTIFNGASNIAQYGALAAFDEVGWKETKNLMNFYMQNAKIIREGLNDRVSCVGGVDAPYIWVHVPEKSSWDTFHDVLERCHVIVVPGSGFGPAGEGFVRLSAFGSREDIIEAVRRLKTIWSYHSK